MHWRRNLWAKVLLRNFLLILLQGFHGLSESMNFGIDFSEKRSDYSKKLSISGWIRLRRALQISATWAVWIILLKFLLNPKLIFLYKERLRHFVYISTVYYLLTTMHNRRRMLSNSLVFLTQRGIFSRPILFLFLIFFFRIESSSTSLNCLSLMSSWVLILFDHSISECRRFSNSFFKCSFHSWSLSTALADFNFAHEVLFFSVS